MLSGTSCRFSVRLRAVTMTSSRVVSEVAPAAEAGATCIATVPDNAAAMASASFEREPCGKAVGPRLRRLAAERVAIVRIASSPFLFESSTARARMLFALGSCLAKAQPVNALPREADRPFNSRRSAQPRAAQVGILRSDPWHRQERAGV